MSKSKVAGAVGSVANCALLLLLLLLDKDWADGPASGGLIASGEQGPVAMFGRFRMRTGTGEDLPVREDCWSLPAVQRLCADLEALCCSSLSGVQRPWTALYDAEVCVTARVCKGEYILSLSVVLVCARAADFLAVGLC